MRHSLSLHPDSRGSVAAGVDVEIERPGADRLLLSYKVTGKVSDILLPPLTKAGRADKLWQQTCFEAFIGAPAANGYYEFNFAPSRQWAAYRFTSYRTGMRVATEIAAISIETQSQTDVYVLQASLELDRLSELLSSLPWRLGLSAIIEDTRGHKSYWALAHPPGGPDFHHTDGFRHELFQSVHT